MYGARQDTIWRVWKVRGAILLVVVDSLAPGCPWSQEVGTPNEFSLSLSNSQLLAVHYVPSTKRRMYWGSLCESCSQLLLLINVVLSCPLLSPVVSTWPELSWVVHSCLRLSQVVSGCPTRLVSTCSQLSTLSPARLSPVACRLCPGSVCRCSTAL